MSQDEELQSLDQRILACLRPRQSRTSRREALTQVTQQQSTQQSLASVVLGASVEDIVQGLHRRIRQGLRLTEYLHACFSTCLSVPDSGMQNHDKAKSIHADLFSACVSVLVRDVLDRRRAKALIDTLAPEASHLSGGTLGAVAHTLTEALVVHGPLAESPHMALELLPPLLGACVEADTVSVPDGKAMPGKKHAEEMIEKLVACQWASATMTAVVALFRDLPASSSQLCRLVQSATTMCSSVSPVELPALVYQLLLVTGQLSPAHRPAIMRQLVIGIERPFAPQPGRDAESLDRERKLALSGALSHCSFAVRQNPTLAKAIVAAVSTLAEALTPVRILLLMAVAESGGQQQISSFSVLFSVLLAPIASASHAYDAPHIAELLSRALAVAKREGTQVDGTRSGANFQDTWEHNVLALHDAIGIAASGCERLIPVLLDFGTDLLDSLGDASLLADDVYLSPPCIDSEFVNALDSPGAAATSFAAGAATLKSRLKPLPYVFRSSHPPGWHQVGPAGLHLSQSVAASAKPKQAAVLAHPHPSQVDVYAAGMLGRPLKVSPPKTTKASVDGKANHSVAALSGEPFAQVLALADDFCATPGVVLALRNQPHRPSVALAATRLGQHCLATLFRRHAEARPSVLTVVSARAATLPPSVHASLGLLASLTAERPLDFAPFSHQLQDIIDALPRAPPVLAVAIIDALFPLINAGHPIRDAILLLLRKSLFSRDALSRLSAATACLEILRRSVASCFHGDEAERVEGTGAGAGASHSSLGSDISLSDISREMCTLLSRALRHQQIVRRAVLATVHDLCVAYPAAASSLYALLLRSAWERVHVPDHQESDRFPIRLDRCYLYNLPSNAASGSAEDWVKGGFPVDPVGMVLAASGAVERESGVRLGVSEAVESISMATLDSIGLGERVSFSQITPHGAAAIQRAGLAMEMFDACIDFIILRAAGPVDVSDTDFTDIDVDSAESTVGCAVADCLSRIPPLGVDAAGKVLRLFSLRWELLNQVAGTNGLDKSSTPLCIGPIQPVSLRAGKGKNGKQATAKGKEKGQAKGRTKSQAKQRRTAASSLGAPSAKDVQSLLATFGDLKSELVGGGNASAVAGEDDGVGLEHTQSASRVPSVREGVPAVLTHVSPVALFVLLRALSAASTSEASSASKDDDAEAECDTVQRMLRGEPSVAPLVLATLAHVLGQARLSSTELSSSTAVPGQRFLSRADRSGSSKPIREECASLVVQSMRALSRPSGRVPASGIAGFAAACLSGPVIGEIVYWRSTSETTMPDTRPARPARKRRRQGQSDTADAPMSDDEQRTTALAVLKQRAGTHLCIDVATLCAHVAFASVVSIGNACQMTERALRFSATSGPERSGLSAPLRSFTGQVDEQLVTRLAKSARQLRRLITGTMEGSLWHMTEGLMGLLTRLSKLLPAANQTHIGDTGLQLAKAACPPAYIQPAFAHAIAQRGMKEARLIAATAVTALHLNVGSSTEDADVLATLVDAGLADFGDVPPAYFIGVATGFVRRVLADVAVALAFAGKGFDSPAPLQTDFDASETDAGGSETMRHARACCEARAECVNAAAQWLLEGARVITGLMAAHIPMTDVPIVLGLVSSFFATYKDVLASTAATGVPELAGRFEDVFSLIRFIQGPCTRAMYLLLAYSQSGDSESTLSAAVLRSLVRAEQRIVPTLVKVVEGAEVELLKVSSVFPTVAVLRHVRRSTARDFQFQYKEARVALEKKARVARHEVEQVESMAARAAEHRVTSQQTQGSGGMDEEE